MIKRRSAKNPLDVADLLRSEPWLTKNEISDRLQWEPETVNDVLKELETERRRDTSKGRAWRYAIKLSRRKTRALELIRRQKTTADAQPQQILT